MRNVILATLTVTVFATSGTAAAGEDDEFQTWEVRSPKTKTKTDTWRGRKLAGPFRTVDAFCADVKARAQRRRAKGDKTKVGCLLGDDAGLKGVSRHKDGRPIRATQWLLIAVPGTPEGRAVLGLQTKRGWYFLNSRGTGTVAFHERRFAVVHTSENREICGGCDHIESRYLAVCGVGRSGAATCTDAVQVYYDLGWALSWSFDSHDRLSVDGSVDVEDYDNVTWFRRLLSNKHRLAFP